MINKVGVQHVPALQVVLGNWAHRKVSNARLGRWTTMAVGNGSKQVAAFNVWEWC